MRALALRTLCFLLFCSPFASGAATYAQNFDNVGFGTSQLVSQGWTFRDQSTAAGLWWWTTAFSVDPSLGQFESHLGTGHLAFPGVGNLQATTTVSSWVILPAIPNQVAGDVLSFYLAGWGFEPGAVVEVRYSPTGGTNTGTTATSVGSFTALLDSYLPPNGGVYLNHQVTLPGAGRLAFRVFGANLPVFGYSPYFQLDTLRFNPPPPPFPIPTAGQTVTWTLGMSPIQIDTDLTIPATGTVVVDPGVEIRVANGTDLFVQGRIAANGTTALPVRFTQVGASGELVPWNGGELDLDHVIMDLYVHPQTGARILASNSTFTAKGSIVNAFDALVDPTYSVLRFDSCVFQGSTVQMYKVVAALRDVDFLAQTMLTDILLPGYVLLEDVSIDGTTIWLGKDKGVQPIFVDGVTVKNAPHHGGLYLQYGTDFLLGPNNVLENNLWPVEFGARCAGLLPGSVVPTSGNVNNYVSDTDDWDPQSYVTWAKLDVPYVVRNFRFMGYQRILPGARIQFAPNTGWQVDGFGYLDACGTEADPIVFERFVPGQTWRGIELFNQDFSQRLEHCVFKGAQRAVVAADVQFDSCRFENCFEGIFSGEAAWAVGRKCEFVSNSIAVNGFNPTLFTDGAILFGQSGTPNSFHGNTIAVRSAPTPIQNTAQNNWWGHPSGPFHPTLNPNGQGDKIETFGPLAFQPYLTSPPDFTDSPPQLAWLDGRNLSVEPGTTLLLSFSAHDDGSIVSQRLRFSANGYFPSSFVDVGSSLTPDQRTVAFTVPNVGFQVNGANAYLRIEAVDDQGQLGYDEIQLAILDPSLAGSVALTTDLSGTHAPGEFFDLDFTATGVSAIEAPSVNAYMLLDNDRRSYGLGGGTYSLLTVPGGCAMPAVSTDHARVVLLLQGSLNRQKWFYSEPFSIRPDAMLGDAPPAITLTSPAQGEVYLAGSFVPVRWTASDDVALRSCDVFVSTDGGRRYTAVALDLSGMASGFDWALPSGVSFSDVRVRVVAHDHRFQNSSDGGDRSFRVITPNSCQSNLGFGSLGGPQLAICGAPLISGVSATLTLSGAPPAQPALLLLSTTLQPMAFFGGTLATFPILVTIPFVTSFGGHLSIDPIPGGGGPATIYLQAVVAAPSNPFGVVTSNAVRADFLP